MSLGAKLLLTAWLLLGSLLLALAVWIYLGSQSLLVEQAEGLPERETQAHNEAETEIEAETKSEGGSAANQESEAADGEAVEEPAESAHQPAPSTPPTAGDSHEPTQGSESADHASSDAAKPIDPPKPKAVEEALTEESSEDVVAALSPSRATPPAVSALPNPRQPRWKEFAQPTAIEKGAPLVSIVITGLGSSRAITEQAIRELPPSVTLSFSPYARRLEEWLALARSHGHEVMIDLPMEPDSYPLDDPGQLALMSNASTLENQRRLQLIMASGSAYIGLAGVMGSRFTRTQVALDPFLESLRLTELLFLDNRSTPFSLVKDRAVAVGALTLKNDVTLDEPLASRDAIDGRLAQVSKQALLERQAIAMAQPFPVTIERIKAWAQRLPETGIQLVPLSAQAKRELGEL